MNLLDFFILSFGSLFVIVDPVGLIPTFLALTEHDPAERPKISLLACTLAFCILIGFIFFGKSIFDLFGITFEAFEIAGGIVLLRVALDMLQARRTAFKETLEETREGAAKHDVAATPLAIPMMAGPGAITTVTLLSNQTRTAPYIAVLTFCIFLVLLATFLILRFVSVHSAKISTIAIKLFSRLMGLLLAAISVQFIINGIKGLS